MGTSKGVGWCMALLLLGACQSHVFHDDGEEADHDHDHEHEHEFHFWSRFGNLAPKCNLTGPWTGKVGDDWLHDEYLITADDAQHQVVVQAISETSWSTGEGQYDPDTNAITVLLDNSITLQGVMRNNCTVIDWNNNSSWHKQHAIKRVHVVFMNHLDVGYAIHTPEGDLTGFIANVVNTYLQEYFPRAISLSNTLRELGYEERFVYTTHPWLVDLFTNCPPHMNLAQGTRIACPDHERMQHFTDAVQRGDIVWHHGPFNLQSESCGDPGLFQAGLDIALGLDAHFGVPTPNHKVYNLRDVPGTTRAVLPLLANYNFSAITIGQNGGTPSVFGDELAKVFKWKDVRSGVEMLVMNNAGGYPGDPGTSAKDCGGICREDCLMVDGFDEALCFAFRTDNSGPPTSIEQLLTIFQILRVEFPGAVVQGSTLPNFVSSLLASEAMEHLDVVEGEIGDTWMLGVPSDPYKVAVYREVMRARRECLEAGTCSSDDPHLKNATRFLLSSPEHTWGLPSESDTANWRNDLFEAHRNDSSYVQNEAGWLEHRTLSNFGIEALQGTSLGDDINARLPALRPTAFPDLASYTQVPIPASGSMNFTCADGATVALSRLTGAIVGLELSARGVQWASPASPLASLVYTTFNETDFDEMNAVYQGPTGGTVQFSKPNATCSQPGCANPTQRNYTTTLQEVWRKGSTCDLWVRLSLPGHTVTYYGGPQTIWLRTNVHDRKAELDLQLFAKTATRLPESMMVSFAPTIRPTRAHGVWAKHEGEHADADANANANANNANGDADNAATFSFVPPRAGEWAWWMDKLGMAVSPHEVILNGNPWQHGVWKGVVLSNGTLALHVDSLDAPVVCPMTPSQVPTPMLKSLRPITEPVTGMGYNLFNNIWNTNYPLYYPYLRGVGDENIRYRFEVREEATQQHTDGDDVDHDDDHDHDVDTDHHGEHDDDPERDDGDGDGDGGSSWPWPWHSSAASRGVVATLCGLLVLQLVARV